MGIINKLKRNYNLWKTNNSLVNLIISKWLKVRCNRLSFVRLTKKEESFYESLEHERNDLKTMDSGKHLHLKELYLINYVKKTDSTKLIKGIKVLLNENPLTGYLGTSGEYYEIKDIIKKSGENADTNYIRKLCVITPRKKLLEISDYCEIYLFNASIDLMGIIFKVKIKESKQNKLEKIFKEIEINGVFYEFWKEKRVPAVIQKFENKNITRNRIYDNEIVKIKFLFMDFFSNALPLAFDYNFNSPHSLNVYSTNYNQTSISVVDYKTFISNQNIIDGKFGEKRKISVIFRTEKGDNFEKINAVISNVNENLDKSTNLVVLDVSNNFDLYTSVYHVFPLIVSDNIINKSINFNKLLLIERNKLFSDKITNELFLQKNYRSFLKNTNTYKLFFPSKIESLLFDSTFHDKLDIVSIEKLHAKNIELLKDTQEEYKFRIEIKNSRSAFWFSVFSIILALIAIIISL